MINLLTNATGLRRFQVMIATSILLLFFLVSLTISFTYLKHHYINEGKQFVIDQITEAVDKQKKKDLEDITHAKQIDKSISALSDSDVRKRLQPDFRDQPENRSIGSVQTMVKDQSKPQGHGRNAQTSAGEQQEAEGLLQILEGCFTAEVENEDGTYGGKTEVCNDG